MKFMKTPKNFEEENWDYLSVGYFEGKVIARNEMGDLYFIRGEETIAPIGTMVDRELAEPITKLSIQEQEEIREIYGE